MNNLTLSKNLIGHSLSTQCYESRDDLWSSVW